jgi:hypothetical protein
MKKIILSYCSVLLAVLFFASCSSSDSDSEQIVPESIVKVELQSRMAEISKTVDNIHNTNGYRILSVSAPQNSPSTSNTKTDPIPNININLSEVKGVYNYSPSNPISVDGQTHYTTIFTRSDNSENFIVKAPLQKALEPWKLHIQESNDNQLSNNLEISASNYKFIENNTNGLDYTLDMSLSLDGNSAGNMFIRNISHERNANVDVRYQFTDAVQATVRFIASANNVSHEFNILENEKVIYKEKVTGIVSSNDELESFEMRIAVDNIEFVKNSENENLTVFRNGEREENVTVNVLGKCGSPEKGFCRDNLNIDITFEDGTKINLASSLGDTSLDKMESLFKSMYQIYFVQFLVDNVAINYKNQNNQQ